MNDGGREIKMSSRIVGVLLGRLTDKGYGLSRRLSGRADRIAAQQARLAELLPQAGACVVDVGANVGGFAEDVFKACPGARILSVEPVPEHVEACRQKFGNTNGYEVVQAALGERSQESVTFQVLPSAPQSSSMLAPSATAKSSFRSLAAPTRPITVPMYSLDDLMATKAGFETIHLLKLNIEGYEPQVLEGGSKTLARCRAVLAEVHFQPMNEGCDTFDRVCQQLRNAGFHYDMLFGEIRNHFGEILLMHMMFVRPS